MFTTNAIFLYIVSFLVGVGLRLVFFPGRRIEENNLKGSLVIDTTNPEGPSAYLVIPTPDVLSDIVKSREKTVTLRVLVHK